ncbi:MAG: IS110 family transposase [Candidatus Dormiibacterota bacterium]
MIYLGIDWAEDHHDLCLLDEASERLAAARVPDGVEGLRRLHELVALHADNADVVVVGIETDRGLLVQGLVASGYTVYAINPYAVSRYRDRHTTSGGKSDRGDAKILADLVRTDRHNHRQIAGDSDLAEAVKVLARAHQNLLWARQRHINQLRSALREFYPAMLEAFGTDLASRDALVVLRLAPTPQEGSRLTRARIRTALTRAGRQRNVDATSIAIHTALASQQLLPPARLSAAYGLTVRASVALLRQFNVEIDELEAELVASFEGHPDAEILCSLPGLGSVLGARVLAEFGDDPTRYKDARSRRCYAGTAPITRASGTRTVVLARTARNKRMAQACYLWAFSALRPSPGARGFYDRQRAKGKTHHQALRALANRLVAVLHGCLIRGQRYDEQIAWPTNTEVAA